MQLSSTSSRLSPCALTLLLMCLGAPNGWAEDRVDFTTTWFQENRRGGKGGLTVVHPQFDVGLDIGEKTELNAGYAADVVSGATASVYRSDAAVDAVSSATTFEDTRHSGHFSFGLRGKRSALRISIAGGFERDYTSISVSGSGNVDLPGKNTNLALAYSHNMDQVCDRDNAMATPLERQALVTDDACAKTYVRGQDTPGTAGEAGTLWHSLSIDTTQATVTQNVSPTVVAQLSLFGQVVKGFQSNPYRRVRVGAVEAQETVPDIRGRVAVTARINKFMPSIRAAVHASLRGYSDTWGVNSGSAELAYSQYVGSSLLMRLRARVYQQTAARFFKDAFYYETEGAAGAYFTGDRELAPVRDTILGSKLTYVRVAESGSSVMGFFDEVRFTLKADVMLMNELAADSLDGNVAGIDNQFLSSGQLFDAFVLQFSLRLAY